jgi:hypothetical protein
MVHVREPVLLAWAWVFAVACSSFQVWRLSASIGDAELEPRASEVGSLTSKISPSEAAIEFGLEIRRDGAKSPTDVYGELRDRCVDEVRFRTLLIARAEELEREFGQGGGVDWRRRAAGLWECGETYLVGGFDSPRYLERAGDALVASGDLLVQNGQEADGVHRYRRALVAYSRIVALGGTDGQFAQRLRRKRQQVEDDVVRIEMAIQKPVGERGTL